MKSFTMVIEHCSETGLYVGYVPGFPGAHSQGETLAELRENIREVIAMLLEDGDPELQSQFVGVETVPVARLWPSYLCSSRARWSPGWGRSGSSKSDSAVRTSNSAIPMVGRRPFHFTKGETSPRYFRGESPRTFE